MAEHDGTISSSITDADCDTNTQVSGSKAYKGPRQDTLRQDTESVQRFQEWLAQEGILNATGSQEGKPIVADGMWGDNSRTAFEDMIRQKGDDFWNNPKIAVPDGVRDALEHLQKRGITKFGTDLHEGATDCVIDGVNADSLTVLPEASPALAQEDAAPASLTVSPSDPEPVAVEEPALLVPDGTAHGLEATSGDEPAVAASFTPDIPEEGMRGVESDTPAAAGDSNFDQRAANLAAIERAMARHNAMAASDGGEPAAVSDTPLAEDTPAMLDIEVPEELSTSVNALGTGGEVDYAGEPSLLDRFVAAVGNPPDLVQLAQWIQGTGHDTSVQVGVDAGLNLPNNMA